MISLVNVEKKYNGHIVLDNLTMYIDKPGLFIIHGINGSGKSTLIKLLSGIIYKTDGEFKINYTVSYLPDKFSMPKLMRVKSYLSIVLNDKTKMDELVSKYQIPNKRIGDLSKGNQQKLGLLQILDYEADCYILDEPLDGLDDYAKKLFKEIIKEKIENNKTIILSLHNKTIFNDLSPTILDIKEGKINEKRKKPKLDLFD